MDPKDYNQAPASPGTPLEPDELEEALPGSQEGQRSYYESQEPLAQPPERSQKAPEGKAHPTVELNVRTGQKSGAPAGKPKVHPTAELHVKPGGRR
jgi:hypothetical protein